MGGLYLADPIIKLIDDFKKVDNNYDSLKEFVDREGDPSVLNVDNFNKDTLSFFQSGLDVGMSCPVTSASGGPLPTSPGGLAAEVGRSAAVEAIR